MTTDNVYFQLKILTFFSLPVTRVSCITSGQSLMTILRAADIWNITLDVRHKQSYVKG